MAAEILHTWESFFRSLASKHGLEIESVSHDPAYGWLVLLADGREFEARSTTSVTAWLKRTAKA